MAKALHGAGTARAPDWIKPLPDQLETEQAPRLIENLREALAGS